MIGVMAQRLFPRVMLARQPQNAVAVEAPPDGRERIAEAEVDAAYIGTTGAAQPGRSRTCGGRAGTTQRPKSG
jgi:hypothetical protein